MQVDQVDVRQVALKAVFDLLHVFGFKICIESDSEQTQSVDNNQQNENGVSTAFSNFLNNFLFYQSSNLILYESSLLKSDSNASGKLIAILTSFLDNEVVTQNAFVSFE